MRIAIVGSRDWPYPDQVRAFVRSIAEKAPDTVIVSGGARGVDSVAEGAARASGLEVVVHEADWNRYGKVAGFKRNTTIVEDADKVLAFWDLRSPGTKNTLMQARSRGSLYLWWGREVLSRRIRSPCDISCPGVRLDRGRSRAQGTRWLRHWI